MLPPNSNSFTKLLLHVSQIPTNFQKATLTELQYDKVNQPSYRFHLYQGSNVDNEAKKKSEIKRQERPSQQPSSWVVLGQKAQNSFSFLDQGWEVD